MTLLLNIYDDNGKPRDGSVGFLYHLLDTREPVVSISHRKMPSEEDHRRFVYGRLYRYWYIITIENERWVGSLSSTYRNEIGIHILPVFQNQGIGEAALRHFIATHKPMPTIESVTRGCWLANIAPSNSRSSHLFARAGFRHVQNTWALEEDTHGHQAQDDEKGASAQAGATEIEASS